MWLCLVISSWTIIFGNIWEKLKPSIPIIIYFSKKQEWIGKKERGKLNIYDIYITVI